MAICNILFVIKEKSFFVKDSYIAIVTDRKNCSWKTKLYILNQCNNLAINNYLEAKIQEDNILLNSTFSDQLTFNKLIELGFSYNHQAAYLLIINSNVLVPPGFLSRLIQCAESDPQIAAINPLTNSASNINIPIAPGANFYGMDRLLAKNLSPQYPDVFTGVSFCSLLRKSAWKEVSSLPRTPEYNCDESFELYQELKSKGYRTVVADNVYVYYQASDSCQDMAKNRQIFNGSWSTEYQRQLSHFLPFSPLHSSTDLLENLETSWDPVQSMRETYHSIRTNWRKRRLLSVGKKALTGIYQLTQARRDIITPEFVAQVTRPNRLRVTYILPGIGIAGGIASVIQLVNELILLGVEARIVAPSIQIEEIENWRFFSQPLILRSEQELLQNFPESDIAVATFWTTAGWAAELVNRGKAKVGAYFIQDYEAWFYPESEQKTRSQVKATYDLINHKIVKSDWLAKLLAEDGYNTTKIPLGMDLGLFYPRQSSKSSKPRVMAMVRPSTPRRGFTHVIEALRLVKETIPETEVILFGDDQLSTRHIPFDFEDQGKITDKDKLAQLYSSADVFLDGSDFQGFGRPALEAMACGTACVVTNVGGVTEYAVDRKNCLVVPPQQPKVFAQKIIELLTNKNLKCSLIAGGLKTVNNYCHKQEASKTL
ncbi:MAG: glycosyltransferase, partial [Cyanobacteria bacterium J083]